LIYDDILKGDLEKEKIKKEEQKEKRENNNNKEAKNVPIKNDKKGKILDPEEQELFNEKMRWFFVLTYVDPNKKNYQRKKESIIKEEPYKMFEVNDNCGDIFHDRKDGIRIEKL
jgi:hypothetical protein